MRQVDRRTFVRLASGAIPLAAHSDLPSIPVIDTHIHLFDTKRPQGVPWPPKNDAVLYKPALPGRYAALSNPFGVVGAIEIEASPWLEDNQWVLDVAEKSPLIVGTVGNLEPGKREFGKQLERYHRNQLFRGIRYGNLWGRDLAARLQEPAFLSDLRTLAKADLVLDTANPDPALIRAVVRLTDNVPNLRVVIDHLPNLKVPSEASKRAAYEDDLKTLRSRPQVFVKLSEVLQSPNRQAALDQLWDTFGQDRVLFGSDWPNSDPFGTYAQVMGAIQDFVRAKGKDAAEKYFWKNSVVAYRWVKRDSRQPG